MGSKQGKSSPAPETQRIHAYDSGGKQHLKPQEPRAGTIRYEVLTLKPQWSHLCSSSRESEPWHPVLRLFRSRIGPYRVGEGQGDGDRGASSLPLAHLYFIIKHFLPHHIALVIIRDDVQQPGEERNIISHVTVYASLQVPRQAGLTLTGHSLLWVCELTALSLKG